jgi:hypothetical protein
MVTGLGSFFASVQPATSNKMLSQRFRIVCWGASRSSLQKRVASERGEMFGLEVVFCASCFNTLDCG